MTPPRLPRVHLYLPPKSRNFSVYYRWEGKTKFVSMDTVFQLLGMAGDPASERDCTAALPVFQGEVTRQFLGGRATHPTPQSVTLGEVARCYTRRLVEGRVSANHARVQPDRLARVVDALGGETAPALSVDTPTVDSWISDRLASGASPTTVHAEVVALRAAFNQAVKDSLIPAVPFSVTPPRPLKRTRVVSPAHWETLLAGCRPQVPSHRFILIAMFSGLRSADIMALTWDDLADGWLRIRTGKTGQVVRFPLHPRLKAFLDECKGHVAHERVIGTKEPNCKRATQNILFGLTGVYRAPPGQEGYSPHEFRHTFLSRLDSAGVGTRVLQALAGHATPTQTLGTYSHPTDEDLEGAIGKL